MAVIPTQQADITAAQTASDDAEGDLSAQQAGHRLQELQVTNDMQTRQLLYSQQIQKSADEADAMAWMSEHT
jgi:conjugal transfer/entry exclusion protein